MGAPLGLIFCKRALVRGHLLAPRAIAAQHGRSRMPAWGAADDDATRIVAVTLENVTLAVALLGDLERAHRSGNPKTIAKVRRRLDRVLDAVAARR